MCVSHQHSVGEEASDFGEGVVRKCSMEGVVWAEGQCTRWRPELALLVHQEPVHVGPPGT